jgi:hypothetical protein
LLYDSGRTRGGGGGGVGGGGEEEEEKAEGGEFAIQELFGDEDDGNGVDDEEGFSREKGRWFVVDFLTEEIFGVGGDPAAPGELDCFESGGRIGPFFDGVFASTGLVLNLSLIGGRGAVVVVVFFSDIFKKKFEEHTFLKNIVFLFSFYDNFEIIYLHLYFPCLKK